jgi:hypothetical protein
MSLFGMSKVRTVVRALTIRLLGEAELGGNRQQLPLGKVAAPGSGWQRVTARDSGISY